jgi:putative aldouronate transport system substrate-binding protein
MYGSDRGEAMAAVEVHAQVSRRRFLEVTGVTGVAVSASLVTACAPRLPGGAGAAGAAPTGAATSAVATGTGVYPSYVPIANGPKADFPSDGPQYDDAFNGYPPSPTPALPGDPPGTGGTVKIMSIQLFPPPSPLDQNPAWQAVNKALNADVQFQIVTQADYLVKLATVMAGSDIPDLTYLYAPTGSSSTLAAANGMPQFLQSSAADLTPYLAGDAARDYPNLAAIPTPAWKNAGCAYQGHLYLVPIHRYLPSQMFVINVDRWNKELGEGYVPRNADDFKRVMLTLTHPQDNVYAIAAAQGTTMHMQNFASIFGAPYGWGQDPSGNLIKDVETPEYRDATAYARDLYASGVFHPDSTTMASNVVARTQFAAGKFVIHRDPINGWQDAWRQALLSSQPFQVRPLALFPARDGGKLQHFVSGGHLWATAVKKSSPDRTRELLRILNWLAAPFGSSEDQLLTFGLPNVDYTLDSSNNPTLTQQGNLDANYVPWKYVVQHPFVFFTPDLPEYARVMHDTEHLLMPYAVSDPTFGQVSETNFSKGASLMQTLNDGITDVIVGRRPMSDYDGLVKDWQSNGGEQIRKEYADSIAKTG